MNKKINLSHWQTFKLNLGYHRFLSVPKDFNFSGNTFKWHEIIYCAWKIIPFVIKAKINGETIDRGIVLVGGTMSKKQWEEIIWAEKVEGLIRGLKFE